MVALQIIQLVVVDQWYEYHACSTMCRQAEPRRADARAAEVKVSVSVKSKDAAADGARDGRTKLAEMIDERSRFCRPCHHLLVLAICS